MGVKTSCWCKDGDELGEEENYSDDKRMRMNIMIMMMMIVMMMHGCKNLLFVQG